MSGLLHQARRGDTYCDPIIQTRPFDVCICNHQDEFVASKAADDSQETITSSIDQKSAQAMTQ